MRFTFKKEPRTTGLAGVGSPNPNTIVKLDKKEVGIIVGPNWRSKDNKWQIRLMRRWPLVPENSKNSKAWKWVQVTQRFDTEPEARKWIQDRADHLISLPLHQLDPDD